MKHLDGSRHTIKFDRILNEYGDIVSPRITACRSCGRVRQVGTQGDCGVRSCVKRRAHKAMAAKVAERTANPIKLPVAS